MLKRESRLINGKNLSWARFVSDLLSPPVVWALMAFPIAFRDSTSDQQAVVWALVYMVLVCILPVMYIVWMVKRGAITDVHMRVRQQRLRPFVFSMACTALAWWVLRFIGAPPIVPLFALFSFVQLAVMAAITLVWQISIHAVSITGVAVATFAFFGPLWALLIVPLVVLVGAARLKLQRHTLAQVLAGSLVGLVVPVILLSLN